MRLIFKFVGKLNNLVLLYSTIASFIFGLIANIYFPTNLFFLKFLLLLGIFNILVFTIRHHETIIIKDFIRVSEDPVLGAEKLKLKNGVFANYNVIISLVVSVFFVIVSIFLGFVNFDVTGFISLILLFATIFISIIGYMLYIHLICFLHRLCNSNIEKFSKFHPAYTSWLVNITKYSGTYQNSFFISGSLYVILFTIHAPDDTLKILSFNTAYGIQDIVLSVAWIVIILAVVIGFPITSYLKSKMIRTIVTNLKIKSSEYYESVVDRVEIDKKLDYIKIIKEIMDSADYPVKTRFNILVASSTSILNLFIAVQKIFPHLFE